MSTRLPCVERSELVLQISTYKFPVALQAVQGLTKRIDQTIVHLACVCVAGETVSSSIWDPINYKVCVVVTAESPRDLRKMWKSPSRASLRIAELF